MPKYVVTMPKLTACLEEKDNVVDACRISRTIPGSVVWKIDDDGKKTAMTRPAPKPSKSL